MAKKKIYVDGVETRYEITDDGKIYNAITSRELKGTYATNEYHTVQLMIDGRSRSFLVHRLVAQAFLENPNNYPVVDHINQNKHDNRVENLRWVTASQNAQNVDRTVVRGARGARMEEDLVPENWRDIPGNENYAVSRYGEVVNKSTKTILKGSVRNGYRRVGIGSKTYSVHLLVWRAFVGEISEKMQIDHIDGNRANNNLENLRMVSQSDNMKNSYRNGHEGQVKVYQYDLDGNFIRVYSTIAEAAADMGVTHAAIKDASNRKGTCSNYYWLREEDKDEIHSIINSWVPEGFTIIPILPTYAINNKGEVYNKRNKRLTPIHYWSDGTHPYIDVRGKHYMIEDLQKLLP